MNLGVLLIPALGGYWLLSRTLLTRYWVARQTGYKLFFSAAIAGVLLLVAARLLAVFLPSGLFAPLASWWRDFAPFDYAGTVAVSAVLAAALPEVANVFTNKNKCAMRAAKAKGDLIECLMQEAVDSKGRMLVEVSTIGSKCYIGFALESGVAASNESDIAITPIASGYREGETRELRITRNYLPALRGSKRKIAEFRVVVPLSQIASARRFDPVAYKLRRHTKHSQSDHSSAGQHPPPAEDAEPTGPTSS